MHSVQKHSFRLSMSARTEKKTIVTIKNYLCTYDLYSPVHNVLDAFISITRASGRELGPGNETFLGPAKWHREVRRVPFGSKKVEI